MKTLCIRVTVAVLLLSAVLLAYGVVPARSGRQETEQERIDRINREIEEKGQHWKAGKTRVGSLSAEERRAMMGLRIPTDEQLSRIPRAEIEASAELPAQFDWRGRGGVSPAKDQGSCGSCWAFATAGQLESFALIYDLRLLDLSEQALMACNTVDQGCNGGFLSTAYDIFLDYGAVDETCMPYRARDGLDCLMYGCEVLASIDDYFLISPATTAAIKQAIYDHGPVACGMFAHDDLSNYESGCYNADHPDTPNHGVLLVGWDDNACGGEGAWIMKNSWGSDWGYDGVGYIRYGVCSIGSFPFYIDYRESAVLVHVDTPDGGESLDVGSVHEIIWEVSRQIPDSISVLLSLNSGASYDSTIVTGLPGTATSYIWTVPELPVSTARIKVVAWYGGTMGGYDMSDGDFRIKGKPYRYVSPSGGDVHPYSVPRWAARRIQDAVNAAEPGDSVMVEGAASYSGPVVVTSPVWLLGGWAPGFAGRDPSTNETTLTSLGSPVSFQYILSGSCGIDGFTITGGTGNGDIQLPFPGNYGGAIFVYQSSPVIRGNLIRSNGYTSPTAASFGGGISCYRGTVTIEDNIFEDNRSQSGGAIYLYDATAYIRRNTVSGSTCDAEFAGERNGGGIYALHSTAHLESNLISESEGYRKGGGIYGKLSTFTLSGDTIRSNVSTSDGGGICTERCALDIRRAMITGNISSGQGGGISHRYELLDIENTVIAMNGSAVIGGGLAADSTWGSIRNNTFDRNRATFSGGNVLLMNTEETEFVNNLVTYGLKYGLQATTLDKVTMRFNDFFGNFPEDVFLVSPDGTNASRNPNYADTTSLDYHPGPHSGAIDGGDPLGPADPDGSRADIGAFGGPGADFAAPDRITGLTATVLGDSVRLEWDACASPDLDRYLVYGSVNEGDLPADSTYISLPALTSTSVTLAPWADCLYYYAGAVDLSGYAGGYSGQAAACTGGDALEPEVTVIRPNGGEFFEPGDTVHVQWVATDNVAVDSLSIWFSQDGGGGFELIASGEENDSTFMWIAPVAVSDSCLIRIIAYDPALNEGADTSDAFFSVKDLTDVEDGGGDPETPVFAYRLEQNYPNPFNGSTTIAYTLGGPSRVDLRIFDTAGRQVRTLERREREAGRHAAVWDGKDDAGSPVTSGVYFCRIRAGKFRQTKKIVYLR